jgi:hypothetical protein
VNGRRGRIFRRLAIAVLRESGFWSDSRQAASGVVGGAPIALLRGFRLVPHHGGC